jgi:hypothetical protein
LGRDDVTIVPLDQDPESVADQLIADTLPETFLDEIDVGRADGMASFVLVLVSRQHQASIERDELIGFVERNRQILHAGGFLDAIFAAVGNATTDERVVSYVRSTIDQMRLVLDGHPESVDVVSDRLLWLCVALGMAVERTSFEEADVAHVLSKPQHNQRITPRAVQYLAFDLLRTYEKGEAPVTAEYTMVVAVCAIMAADLVSLVTSFAMLMALSPASDVIGWSRVVEDTAAAIAAQRPLTSEQEEFLRRVRSRHAPGISDDDF